MEKYKLINRKTKEEYLCEKVTIDGFDYYVSDEKFDEGDYIIDGLEIRKASSKLVNAQGFINRREWKKVVATNNPYNIYISIVVDENYLL